MENIITQNHIPVDVVIIDDEDSIREGCKQILEQEGLRAEVAANGTKGLIIVEEVRPRIVLLDLRMPGISGIEVLERLPGIDSRIIPIVITGYGTVESAVDAMKLGAFDFVKKPFDSEKLLEVIGRGMEQYQTLQASTSAATPVGTQETVRETPAGNTPPSEPDILLRLLEGKSQSYALGMEEYSLNSQLKELEAEADYYTRQLGQVQQKSKAIEKLVCDFRDIDQLIKKHGFRKSALIQILLDLQQQKRWLPRHSLTWISKRLNISLAQIYEIVTFYEAFSLTPQGRHTIQVCMGTACQVRHAPELRQMLMALLGIRPGQTDARLLFTLKEVHCLGCCALAPVMKIDDTCYSAPSYKELKAILNSYEKELE
jgi:NADH:ubiquinone oxidoreductase subunit E/FixJ family two-component response regulator